MAKSLISRRTWLLIDNGFAYSYLWVSMELERTERSHPSYLGLTTSTNKISKVNS